MQSKKREIEVVVFPIIGNPVVEQKQEENNSNTNNRNQNCFPQFKQTRLPVNIRILTGYVINCDPEGRDKNKCQVKITVELNRYFIPKFNWLDVNLSVNEKQSPANNGRENVENQIPGYL